MFNYFHVCNYYSYTKVPYPEANPFIQLDNVASLYGLSFRIVAIESL